MGRVVHPLTGESWRDEVYPQVFCPSGEMHDMERIRDTWAEIIERCRRCGAEVSTTIG